jgi:phage terminase Nu1 subunit (DNA packaging protein)
MTGKSPMKRKVSAAVLAKYLDLSERHIGRLADEKVLPRQQDGKQSRFDLDICRLKYIRYLRDEGRRVVHSDSRERASTARAEVLELRAAKERGELCHFADIEEVFSDVIGTWRSELSGMPAACTRDLSLRQTMEGYINDTADRCQHRWEAMCATLQAGGKVGVEDEEGTA